MTADPTKQLFQNLFIPDGTELAGLSALVHTLGVEAPVRQPAAVSRSHIKDGTRTVDRWRVFDKRYQPGPSLKEHLSFALRHETLDLLVLKRVFERLNPKVLCDWIQKTPSGPITRRAWFLYEFLTGQVLPVKDAGKVTAVELLDSERYITGPGKLSRRHRVRNNLLGVASFCPIIRRTELLQGYLSQTLNQKAQETVGRVSTELMSRAASLLLLADSRASFEIEGERPPRSRLERWGQTLLQAGRYPLSLAEITRLHRSLIVDNRFVQVGLRPDGVFLGERTRDGEPLPEFIGARPDDLTELLEGLIEASQHMGEANIDPVIQAAIIAFGFVYIHPLQDGNGRLHRYLIHHVLAERKFTPTGMLFPVSSVMLDRIEDYRAVLQAHSAPLMAYIDWRPTPNGKVEVLNRTADLYRYADMTGVAEFLYGCVARTVEVDLPEELDYLKRHDQALQALTNQLDLPNRVAEDFIMFVRQNGGTLPKGRRQKEFGSLSDAEVATLEGLVQEAFEDL